MAFCVPRDVVVPQEGVGQARLFQIGRFEWGVGLFSGLLPRQGGSLGGVGEGDVHPIAVRMEVGEEVRGVGGCAVSCAP